MRKPNYKKWFERKMKELNFRYVAESDDLSNIISFGRTKWTNKELKERGWVSISNFEDDPFKYASKLFYKCLNTLDDILK